MNLQRFANKMEKEEKIENLVLTGIPASPGIAVGKVHLLDRELIQIKQEKLGPEEVEREIERFKKALKETRDELLKTREKVKKSMAPEQVKIFDAQILILEDDDINRKVIKEISELKTNAEFLYKKAMESTINAMSSSKNQYIKERVYDIEAVSNRLLYKLLGIKHLTTAALTSQVILLARSLSPGDVVHMRKDKVLGFAADSGGGTSHVALLAKALGIPAVLGLKNAFSKLMQKQTIILDGDKGILIISPDEQTLKDYELRRKNTLVRKGKLLELKALPAETLDHRRIQLQANIELPEDVDSALIYGAEGIGVYRTEYLYLTESAFPSEEEQYKAYRKVLEKMSPHPVVIRTYDLGGDKFRHDLGESYEANPFLGWRAIRACLDLPNIFKAQLKAMLRASEFGNLKIMFPMISGVEELKKAKGILNQVKEELKSQKVGFDENAQVGIMIEIPSACLVADSLAQECDFFSIGTNDLTQYSLAVDRGNERVANLYETFHPAVLRLIKQTIDSAHRNKIWVGLCGEMAADPFAIGLLVGMGIDELSSSPLAIPQIKKIIRSITMEDAEKIAEKVLNLTRVEEIKRTLKQDYKKRFGQEELLCLY
jgi:phosphotransferase system enzyme I (PtsI)